MITGLPVIASKVGGIPEIINNKNGLLVESENSEKLANTLLDLIANPDKRKKLSAYGQKTVLEKFTAKKMAEEYEKEYSSITKT
jgi:phosphatidylinositol alpha-mannosyltransferase